MRMNFIKDWEQDFKHKDQRSWAPVFVGPSDTLVSSLASSVPRKLKVRGGCEGC